MPVEHEARPVAGSGQRGDGLARHLARLGGMRHLEHLDFEADVREVVGEEVGDLLLLEGRAGNADGRLLESQDLLVGDSRQDAVRQVSRHRSTPVRAAEVRLSWEAPTIAPGTDTVKPTALDRVPVASAGFSCPSPGGPQ